MGFCTHKISSALATLSLPPEELLSSDSQVLKFISQVSQVYCALDQGKLALKYSKAFAIGLARPYQQLELHLICLHHTDTKGLPALVLLTGTSIYSSFETLCSVGKVPCRLHRFMFHPAE